MQELNADGANIRILNYINYNKDINHVRRGSDRQRNKGTDERAGWTRNER